MNNVSAPLKAAKQAGFTLVELAIVLVIIGLLVGGVLVGQDLIKAAEIRSIVTDLDKYNAAATTFRTKYGGLPGDLLATRASQFNDAAAVDQTIVLRDGLTGCGDGNGLIEGGAAAATALTCETRLFWTDLTAAQLIQSSSALPTAVTYDATTSAVAATAELANVIPSTKLRDTSYIHVFPVSGRNYFYVGNMSVAAGGVITVEDLSTSAAALSPLEASQLDEKIDDGRPASGITRTLAAIGATGFTPSTPAAAAATGECALVDSVTATLSVYNIANADFGNELSCNLFIRASF